MGYDLLRFVGEVDEEFHCSICSMVFERPVETPCDHVFCTECITKWLSLPNDECPIDRRRITVNELQTASRAFRNLLAKLNIKCDFDECDVVVALDHLQNHVTNCSLNPNAKVVCDRGCNKQILRRDQETHNCLAHLLNLLSQQEIEMTKQKEAIEGLQSTVAQFKATELHQNNEIHSLNEQIDEMNRQLGTIPKIGDNSTPLNWKVGKNLRIGEQSNIFECSNRTLSHKYFAQSDRPLRVGNSSFKVQVLNLTVGFTIGLASLSENRSNFQFYYQSVGGIKGAIGFGDNFHSNQEAFGAGDIIQCGVRQNLEENERVQAVVYFSKNERIVMEKTFRVHSDHLFPTILFYAKGTRVKILTS